MGRSDPGRRKCGRPRWRPSTARRTSPLGRASPPLSVMSDEQTGRRHLGHPAPVDIRHVRRIAGARRDDQPLPQHRERQRDQLDLHVRVLLLVVGEDAGDGRLLRLRVPGGIGDLERHRRLRAAPRGPRWSQRWLRVPSVLSKSSCFSPLVVVGGGRIRPDAAGQRVGRRSRVPGRAG